MADTIKYVNPDNPSGTDYTSLVSWEAGRQRIVASGDREIAICRSDGSVDTNSIGTYIDGWTVNGEIIIMTEPAYRHKGVYPSSGNIYRLTTSASYRDIIRTYESNVTIDGLAIKCGSSSGYACVSNSGNVNNIKILNNYLHANTTNRACNFIVGVSGYKQFFVNNIAYDCSIGFAGGGVSGGEQYFYNNVCSVFSDLGFRCYTSKGWYYNNISINRGNTFYNCYGVITQDTNCQETSGYTSLSTNLIYGTPGFVNEGGGDFNLTKTDTLVKGLGIDLSSDSEFPFDYDYAGNKRQSGKWDLGVHQISKLSGYHLMV